MSFFGIGKKKKSNSGNDFVSYKAPEYVPSIYDEKSSKDIFDFYDPRIRGENLGYGEEDLNTMRGDAQDYSTRQTNEAIRRGAASRRAGTGGTWSGGRDSMRDEAIRGGLEYRSNAMRDIAVRNAVLKHQDQWNAASGMGTFLNNERQNALSKWTGANQGAAQEYRYNQVNPQNLSTQSNQFNRAGNFNNAIELAKLGLNLYNTMR